jgi:formylglycine-generating enzyme required for sulfatase activity
MFDPGFHNGNGDDPPGDDPGDAPLLQVFAGLVARLERDPGDRDAVETVAVMAGNATVPLKVRIEAARVLARLGDPRLPVKPAEWSAAIGAAVAGVNSGYFVRVPAGTYWLGSAVDEPDVHENDQPCREYHLEYDLLIARYLLTNAQWNAWIAEGGSPSRYADDDHLNGANQPVLGVRWRMISDYCHWLSRKLAADLPDGLVLRPPIEEEWEIAARGVDGRRYPWGNEPAGPEHALFGHRFEHSLPVGLFPAGASPFGVLDMAGNVAECTSSDWSAPQAKEPAIGNSTFKVLRGGDYCSEAPQLRCAHRKRIFIQAHSCGLRLVLAPAL